jgi:hypothetical protein
VRRIPSLLGAAALTAYAAMQWLGRTAGATPEERGAAMPGDDLVPRAELVTDHGVSVDAPADRVWPWLTMMGWHLGGYYTPYWVDRVLFPGNWSSLDRLDPRLLRDLQPGDTIPDGPPGTAEHVVVDVEAPHLLLTRSTTHIPPGWDEKYDARMAWTWCFRLTEDSNGATRIHLRVRGRMEPWWFRVLYLATIVPADAIMGPGMLRGLKRRVEADLSPAVSGRDPLTHDRRAEGAGRRG